MVLLSSIMLLLDVMCWLEPRVLAVTPSAPYPISPSVYGNCNMISYFRILAFLCAVASDPAPLGYCGCCRCCFCCCWLSACLVISVVKMKILQEIKDGQMYAQEKK